MPCFHCGNEERDVCQGCYEEVLEIAEETIQLAEQHPRLEILQPVADKARRWLSTLHEYNARLEDAGEA